jgi:hypothetical protein
LFGLPCRETFDPDSESARRCEGPHFTVAEARMQETRLQARKKCLRELEKCLGRQLLSPDLNEKVALLASHAPTATLAGFESGKPSASRLL